MEINTNPIITVVTVCFNAENEIEKTIQSVLNQSYKNIEYIIIDGGSTDGTVDIIKKYADRLGYWVSELDKGIYDAMNKGITHATGEWINFLNAGDYYYNDFVLELLFKNFTTNIGADILYGIQVHKFNYGLFVRKQLPLSDFKKYMPIGHPSTFVKTCLMKEMPYDCRFRIAADYNFFYQQYIKGSRFVFRNIIVSVFESETGISSSSKITSFKETAIVNHRYRTLTYYYELIMIFLKEKNKFLLEKIAPQLVQRIQRKKRLNNLEYIPLKKYISSNKNA